jgi:hypothetical protein
VKIWTVISCGDGEVHSAWVSQNLAWEAAQALAERINARVSKQSMSNIFSQTRVVVRDEGHEIAVETFRRLSECQRQRGELAVWANHATVRVSAVEVQGDAVSALAKVAE